MISGLRRQQRFGLRPAMTLFLLGVCMNSLSQVEAGGLLRKRARPVPVVPTAVQVGAPAPDDVYPMLGTFYPTPVMTVRGNFPTSGGYAPLGQFGETTTALYGPTSALRATSAPVLTYSRGYDGRPIIREGTSFSTPNLPSITPVIYPTQATYFYGPRSTGNPPWWANGINWIDQN
jgi:hypothetical protein